jgi:hypothetical protein
MPAGLPVDQNNFQTTDLSCGATYTCTNGGYWPAPAATPQERLQPRKTALYRG